MDNDKIAEAFRFFTEVGIIAQLSATLLERHLPERLTNTHFGLLSHLSRRPEGSTPQQMAFAFQVPKTSMTHMIKVLEAEGCVDIGPNPEDARSKLVRITPEGGTVFQNALAGVTGEIAEMEPGLDLDAVRACLEPLATIRAQLETARNKDRPV